MSRRFATHYARVNPRHPEGYAVCDLGGEARRHSELVKEMVWRGARKSWSGFMVCRDCMDVQNEQDRLLILRPDPPVLKNIRPELPYKPLVDFINDGIATTTQTAGIVADGYGAPLLDDGQPTPARPPTWPPYGYTPPYTVGTGTGGGGGGGGGGGQSPSGDLITETGAFIIDQNGNFILINQTMGGGGGGGGGGGSALSVLVDEKGNPIAIDGAGDFLQIG